MKNIYVVSGVAGMTGGLVASKLLERGESVIGFDNFFAGSRRTVECLKSSSLFTFFEYDIASNADMKQLFSYIEQIFSFEQYCRYFINCAAVVHTKHFYSPDDTFVPNVVAMKDTLDLSIKHNFKAYIQCSTSEVYSMKSFVAGGVREDEPVLVATAEQTLRTSYATGKLMTEFFIRDAAERNLIKGCSIRFANVYSPEEEHYEHIIPFAFSSLMNDGKITLLENSQTTMRTFLHNSDSCMSILCLLDCEQVLDGSVYNVGTDEEISIIDLVHKIGKLVGITNVQFNFKGNRSADPGRRLLNTDKIKRLTCWRSLISLDTGLALCWEFHKNRGCVS